MNLDAIRIETKDDRAEAVKYILQTAKAVFHRIPNTKWTVCVITFQDGWQSVGKSVCVNPDDFNEELGQTIAFNDALDDAETHYWRTFGYLASIGMKELSYVSKTH